MSFSCIFISYDPWVLECVNMRRRTGGGFLFYDDYLVF